MDERHAYIMPRMTARMFTFQDNKSTRVVSLFPLSGDAVG